MVIRRRRQDIVVLSATSMHPHGTSLVTVISRAVQSLIFVANSTQVLVIAL